MDNKYKLFVGIGVLVAIVLPFIFRPTKTVVERVVENVRTGSVSSPDINSPYFSVNNVRRYKARIPFTQGTTTPIAYLTPAATSTLERATCRINTASTTATFWILAKATTAFATTTAFGTEFAPGANGYGTFIASSTPGAAGAKDVFAPNTYLVLGVRGGDSNGDTNPRGFVPDGACNFTFEEVW